MGLEKQGSSPGCEAKKGEMVEIMQILILDTWATRFAASPYFITLLSCTKCNQPCFNRKGTETLQVNPSPVNRHGKPMRVGFRAKSEGF